MNEVKKQIELTQKDYIIHKYTEFLGSLLKDIGMLITAVLFFVILYLYKNFDMSFFILVLSAVPIGMYIYSLVYYIPKNAAAEYKNSSYNKIKIVVKVDRENLTVDREGRNESVIKLNQLLSFWETRKYFYFFITQQNLLILPKRQLDSEELNFMHEVSKTLSAKQKRNPYRVKFKTFVLSALSMMFITFCVVMIILSFTMKK